MRNGVRGFQVKASRETEELLNAIIKNDIKL